MLISFSSAYATLASLFVAILLLPADVLSFPTKPGTCTLSGITSPSGHGVNSAPACPGCYYLTLTKSNNPPAAASGNTWNVVLNGPHPVKGMMMWVFDSSNTRFGSWVSYPTYTAPFGQCGGVNPQGNTLAHTSSQFKQMPLNMVWSDIGYATKKLPTKRSRSSELLQDEILKDVRPGMKEEIAVELEKRGMIVPGSVIPTSAIPAAPSGTKSNPSATTKSGSVKGSPTTTPGAPGGTNSTGPTPNANATWTGTMVGLVVVDFSDWYFISKVLFDSTMASAGGTNAGNSTNGGGTNSTAGGGGNPNNGADDENDNGPADDGGGGIFIVGPSEILSKNHMLYVALGLSAAFFLSGWGVEGVMTAQEKKVMKYAKKWST